MQIFTLFAAIVEFFRGRGTNLKKEVKEVTMTYKTPELKAEFDMLERKNKRLREVILDAANFTEENFGKGIVITHIYRTQEQQEIFYSEGTTKKSPHQFWHGVDLRSRVFNRDEIDKLVDYLNEKYNTKNYYKFTAMCHNIGHGDHFHIQFYER